MFKSKSKNYLTKFIATLAAVNMLWAAGGINAFSQLRTVQAQKTKSVKQHRKRKQRVLPAKALMADDIVPQVGYFTTKKLHQYNLLGTRWTSKTITYDDQQLPPALRKLTRKAIKQLNQLKIVQLKPTTNQANIVIKAIVIDKHTKKHGVHPKAVGSTAYKFLTLTPGYKNLMPLTHAEIVIDPHKIKCRKCFDHVYQRVLLHELGHALGLDHTAATSGQLMAPIVTIDDNKPAVLDEAYVRSLAVLYRN